MPATLTPSALAPRCRTRVYGQLPDGRAVHEITLSDGSGFTLAALTLGGIVNALHVPDRDGRHANVVLGFDNLTDYVERNPHFGVIVGRYANRIARGKIEIDGQAYTLPRNNGSNCLHGGPLGFGTRLWELAATTEHDAALGGPALTLAYASEDGEQGFPGRLETRVTYSLRPGRRWQVDYEARTDRATVVNLSHHDYFNLAGAGSAMGHELMLAASRYNPIDADFIPTGIAPVDGSPFDFRTPTRIGARLRDAHPQLAHAGGYDHNWLIDAPADAGVRLGARLRDPVSGRSLALHTSEPAIQFYSGNFLDGTLVGPGGVRHERESAICLEPQHSPDSPHHPEWPSTVLRPGAVYRSCSVYEFGVEG